MIDQFSKETFEEYLEQHKPYEALGIIQGEYAYKIVLDGQASIMLRSSIKANGVAASSGKDSIRLWLVDSDNKPIGSKITNWTTRVNGWQSRLNDKVLELVKRRVAAGDCPQCQKPFGIYKRKSDKKLFAKCFPCSKRTGRNINGNLATEGIFSVISRNEAQAPETRQTAKLDGFLANPFDEDEPPIAAADDFTPNKQQKNAINQPVDVNVRLFAGPGAGKTFAIKHRYNYLVSNGVLPRNVLVITYSKSMADEMSSKILSLTPSAKKEQMSTIHAFCYRELARNNPELKYYGWSVPGKHAPLKSWQIKSKIEDLVKEIWHKNVKEKPGYREVLEWIDRSKYYGVTQKNAPDWFIDHLGSYYGLPMAKIRVQFDRWLYQHECMTFADMLYLMELELIQNSEFKTKMQTKYTHLIVDESQDTNYQAFKVLFHILDGGAKLFLVGDVNQMMYRFQGARPELITDEISKIIPDIKTIILEKNHRSHDEIINAFQSLIAHNYSDHGGPYKQEFFQGISGVKGIGGQISFNMAPDVFEESAQIANEIETLTANGGYNANDIFVGARTKAQLGYLEGELFKKGIKFINIAGGSFWDSKHVKAIVSYLRLAHDTNNSEALKTVANIASNNNCYTWNDKSGKFQAGDYCPVRYLGQKFLEKIGHNFNNIDRFLISASDAWRYKTNDRAYDQYGPTKAQDLQEFVWSLQDAALQADNVGQVVRVIIDDCYAMYLKATEGSASDDESNLLDNLVTVVDIASQYEKIEDFLAYVDEMLQAARDTKDKDWSDYTVISTYHRLKGLERKIIFGMGWCEGEDIKTGKPAGLLPHTFSLTEPPQFGVLPAGAMSPIEDERCIAFVCISRAIESVYLSGCEIYRNSVMTPSRFVKEIGLLDE